MTEKLHELNIQIETMGYQFEAMREELTAKDQTIALMTTELKKREEEIENLTRSNKKVGNDAQRKNVSAHEGDPPTNNNPVNVNNNKNQKRKICLYVVTQQDILLQHLRSGSIRPESKSKPTQRG